MPAGWSGSPQHPPAHAQAAPKPPKSPLNPHGWLPQQPEGLGRGSARQKSRPEPGPSHPGAVVPFPGGPPPPSLQPAPASPNRGAPLQRRTRAAAWPGARAQTSCSDPRPAAPLPGPRTQEPEPLSPSGPSAPAAPAPKLAPAPRPRARGCEPRASASPVPALPSDAIAYRENKGRLFPQVEAESPRPTAAGRVLSWPHLLRAFVTPCSLEAGPAHLRTNLTKGPGGGISFSLPPMQHQCKGAKPYSQEPPLRHIRVPAPSRSAIPPPQPCRGFEPGQSNHRRPSRGHGCSVSWQRPAQAALPAR